MSVSQHQVRSGVYFDSVMLMQLQRDLAALPEVEAAGVVMATQTNQALLAQSGLLPDGIEARPDDLLIVVRAENEGAAEEALNRVDDLLTRRRSLAAGEYRPRSLEAAFKQLPEAGWVLVSVPGKYAASVAREALEHDRHVFLYSDNVSLEDEVALKALAAGRGKLLMGPDCGTAIVNGVGLGFANRVRRGGVGLVGASGTGLQAVSVHLHQLGVGVSHALGTGGRDLSAEVGGATTTQCLDLLGRDPGTQVIALVSKPPDPRTAARLFAAAQALEKPVVVNLLGYPPPASVLGNLYFATNLKETATLAGALLAEDPADSGPLSGEESIQGFLRGLFSGGTLAAEVLFGLRAVLTPLYANLHVPSVELLDDPTRSRAHTIVDLGADEFTVGRLHPMIDHEVRLRRLRQEAADPEVGILLLDVVLGDGAHPDPAEELAPAIAAARSDRELPVVVILIGTDQDPQNVDDQESRLAEVGAKVFRDAGSAVAYLNAHLRLNPDWPGPPVALEDLAAPLAAVNVGLESFYLSLVQQEARAVQVNWRPPAGGDDKMLAILAKLKG